MSDFETGDEDRPDLLNRGGHSPAFYNRNPTGETDKPHGQRGENEAPPADFLHSTQVYREMFRQAKRVEVADGADMIVYEGHLTRLFTDLNFSTPYYSKITKALKAMGCIRQLRRGGGGTESQWELRTEPTLELYREKPYKGRNAQPYGVAQVVAEQNAQQIRNLATRVSALETTVEQLVGALATEPSSD